MDSKLSEYPEATNISSTDKFPIISANANKIVSAGVLFQNIPNIGNKGITKNVVTSPTSVVLPLTGTLINLPFSALPYTLGSGVSGQCLVIVSNGINTLQFGSKTATFPVDGSITLHYITNKWIVTANIGCTVV